MSNRLSCSVFLVCCTVSTAQSWTAVSSAIKPSARSAHAMTYDSVRNKVVLFGGSTGGGETWEYDAAGWVLRSPPTSPPPRVQHVMAFDSARGVTVLFAGQPPGGGTLLGDTWEWNGTTWAQKTSPTSPLPRVDAAMAFDAARSRIVLYGGNATGTDPNDTWEWNGTSWMQVTSATPIGTTRGIMIYDPGRSRCQVMTTPTVNFLQMYEFDGSTWTLLPDHTGGLYHRDRKYPCGAFLGQRRRLLTYGGSGTTGPNNASTEEWDNYLWFEWSASDAPGVRSSAAMTYDSSRDVAVMFGGAGSGSIPLGDTWEWSDPYAPPKLASYGAGCPNPVLNLDPQLTWTARLPILGRTFRVNSNGGSGASSFLVLGWSKTIITASNIPLPFDLGLIGMTGCSLLADPVVVLFQGVRNTNWDFPIPNSTIYLGGTAYLQAILAGSGANPLNLVTSNGIQFTIGG